jgi:hypothetical protein
MFRACARVKPWPYCISTRQSFSGLMKMLVD